MDRDLVTCVQDGHTIVRVDGEIDADTAPALCAHLLGLLAAGNLHLVVDLGEVRYLSSAALAVLVRVLKRTTERSGSLRLVCAQEQPRQVFRITGLCRVFDIHLTVTEAISTSG